MAKKVASVLSDHKQVGSKFVPPLMAMSLPMTPVHWMEDILPELIWIALIRQYRSERRAAEICVSLARTSKETAGSRTGFSFAGLSSFAELDSSEAKDIVEKLPTKDLEALRELLAPLVSLYPECPLSFLYTEQPATTYATSVEESIAVIKRAVQSNTDRRDKEAMLTQRIYAWIPAVLGLMHYGSPSFVPNFDSLDDYPQTDESKLAASKIRAQINAFVGGHRSKSTSEWKTYFWRQGYKISSCEVSAEATGDGIAEHQARAIAELLGNFPEKLEEETQNLWLSAPIDVASNQKDEVLGGLLARQVRLTSQMASETNLWALDLGRIVLRCMVDTYINFAWLCKFGTEKHFKDFVEYGLGQEKLLVEHFKAQSTNATSIPEEARDAENWIEGQLLMHFLPVDVGDWIGKSKRKMAEELDAKEIYSLAFSPFSGAVHGMWHSIARVNLQRCFNPLHKWHRLPNFGTQPLYLASVHQAVDIMQRTLVAFCQNKGLAVPSVCVEVIANLREILEPVQ